MKRFQVEHKQVWEGMHSKNTSHNYKSYLIALATVIGIITCSFNISYADSTVTSVPTGSSPTSISHASSYTYVTNFGSNTVSVIDNSNNVVGSISVGIQPYGTAYNSNNGKIYVTNYGSNTVSVIDPSTNTAVSTMPDLSILNIILPSFTNPCGLLYYSTNNDIYVTNFGSNTVSVIDASTNSAIATITVGAQPYGIVYNSNNGKIYVTNYGSNTISVIDPSSNTVISTISGVTNPAGITYDLTNHNIYVSNSGSTTVSVIDTSSNNIINTISVGSGPIGIAYSTLTNNIYVSNFNSNSVSVIDGSSNTVTSTISVDQYPYGISYNSNNGKIYVANFGSNTASIIGSTSTPIPTPIPTPTPTPTIILSTTTTLTTSANPSVFGQPVTFTANVTSTSGTPTGSVTFSDGSSTLGSCTLSGNSCTLSSSSLLLGTHTITAAYGGDSNFSPSTSTSLTQTVKKVSTTVTVTSSANPSIIGQSITILAGVSTDSQGYGTPTGTVTFFDGSTIIGTGILNNGIAMLSTSFNLAGSHSITASYSGNSNFDKSTSSILAQNAQYKFTGFLSPINGETDSLGSTLQIKFPLYDAYNNLVLTATGTVLVDGNPATSAGSLTSSTGNIITFSTSGNYKFSMNTSGLTVGAHTISVVLNDGSVHNVLVNLK